MTSLAIIGIAFSLSMDAFAASISTGCSMGTPKKRFVLAIAVSFGFFQGVMPLLGFYSGLLFKDYIQRWNHWAAFLLLSGIGAKMIYEGLKEGRKAGCEDPEIFLSFRKLITLSIATSIDALVIGVSFAILDYPIFFPAAIIALVTFIVSVVGVISGKILQHIFSEYVDILAGVILVGLGIKILIEHLA